MHPMKMIPLPVIIPTIWYANVYDNLPHNFFVLKLR